VDEGTIAPQDLDLFSYVDTAEAAWETILQAEPAKV
jgi:predicted Rossmann-fold nucleotide-binding protein